jgi:hypothetical protein
MKDWAVSYQDGIGIFDGIGCFIPCDGSRELAEFAAKWFNECRINGRDDIAEMWEHCLKGFKSTMNYKLLKIERKSKREAVEFRTLKPGTVFEYGENVLIKCSLEDKAFDFSVFCTVIFQGLTMVVPRNATLTVEN